jgi:hypothetical protein
MRWSRRPPQHHTGQVAGRVAGQEEHRRRDVLGPVGATEGDPVDERRQRRLVPPDPLGQRERRLPLPPPVTSTTESVKSKLAECMTALCPAAGCCTRVTPSA